MSQNRSIPTRSILVSCIIRPNSFYLSHPVLCLVRLRHLRISVTSDILSNLLQVFQSLPFLKFSPFTTPSVTNVINLGFFNEYKKGVQSEIRTETCEVSAHNWRLYLLVGGRTRAMLSSLRTIHRRIRSLFQLVLSTLACTVRVFSGTVTVCRHGSADTK